MADRRLDVYLDGTRAGQVTMTGAGNLSFDYDETYRSSSGATPLSLSMPRTTPRHRQRAVLPFLQGLLPDNEQALGAVADEGTRLGLSPDQSRHIVDGVLSAVPNALELARTDVLDVPGGKTVADTVISNLRAISPLYPNNAPILLTGGPHKRGFTSSE